MLIFDILRINFSYKFFIIDIIFLIGLIITKINFETVNLHITKPINIPKSKNTLTCPFVEAIKKQKTKKVVISQNTISLIAVAKIPLLKIVL